MAQEKGAVCFPIVRFYLLVEPGFSVSLSGSNCLSHMACHVLLRHERGCKCSGITNSQSNYQKRKDRRTEMTEEAFLQCRCWLPIWKASRRRKTLPEGFWTLPVVSLLFPKDVEAMSSTPSLSSPWLSCLWVLSSTDHISRVVNGNYVNSACSGQQSLLGAQAA